MTADGATLAWTASAGATGYTVFADGSAVASSRTPSVVVADLAAGTPYSLSVAASGTGGTSVPSGTVPIVTVPGSPTLTVQDSVATLTFTGDTGSGGPTWAVLDNGVPMTGVTSTSDGSTVQATIPGLAQGTAYSFSVRASIPGAVSPATSPLTFLVRSTPTVSTSGTVQTLTWAAAPTGVSWSVQGCSSVQRGCTGTTPVATGPIVWSGGVATTTVTGCSPTLYYRYRVIDTDLATHTSKAGAWSSALLG